MNKYKKILIIAIGIEFFIILILRSYNIKIQSVIPSIICSFLFLLPIQALLLLSSKNNELTSKKRIICKFLFLFISVCYLLVVIGLVFIECGFVTNQG